jgi:hypothetical protein
MQQFKIHFSYNESGGGVSLLKQVIKADNIEDAKIYLMKKFDSFFMIDFENIDMRLSNFSAHKTLLILCSNGKDRYQQKAS